MLDADDDYTVSDRIDDKKIMYIVLVQTSYVTWILQNVYLCPTLCTRDNGMKFMFSWTIWQAYFLIQFSHESSIELL